MVGVFEISFDDKNIDDDDDEEEEEYIMTDGIMANICMQRKNDFFIFLTLWDYYPLPYASLKCTNLVLKLG